YAVGIGTIGGLPGEFGDDGLLGGVGPLILGVGLSHPIQVLPEQVGGNESALADIKMLADSIQGVSIVIGLGMRERPARSGVGPRVVCVIQVLAARAAVVLPKRAEAKQATRKECHILDLLGDVDRFPTSGQQPAVVGGVDERAAGIDSGR